MKLSDYIHQQESQFVIDTLIAHDYNILKSANQLGITRQHLYWLVNKYRIKLVRKKKKNDPHHSQK